MKNEYEINRELPGDWKFSKTRLELYCPHGVGHPIPQSTKKIHGCCQENCCDPDNEDSKWQDCVELIEERLNIEPSEEIHPRGFP